MKEIQKIYRIKALPEEVYTAITNPFSIELWSGYPAIFEGVAGGRFELFDGDIEGVNIQLVENTLVEQEWFFGDQDEPSIVKMELSSKGTFTLIKLRHTNIPDDLYDNMKEGWENSYWGAIIRYFK